VARPTSGELLGSRRADARVVDGVDPVSHLAPPLVRVAVAGFLGAVVTGALLFTMRPAAYSENPAFLAKLAPLAVGLLNVVILRLNPRWAEIDDGRQAPILVKAAALTSLVVWLGAVLAGRWIGFLQLGRCHRRRVSSSHTGGYARQSCGSKPYSHGGSARFEPSARVPSQHTLHAVSSQRLHLQRQPMRGALRLQPPCSRRRSGVWAARRSVTAILA
jgi:hypothetical protein